MSKCSKKCNEIKAKIDSISGLDDNMIYFYLKILEHYVDITINTINKYADRNELNGTCFKSKTKFYLDGLVKGDK